MEMARQKKERAKKRKKTVKWKRKKMTRLWTYGVCGVVCHRNYKFSFQSFFSVYFSLRLDLVLWLDCSVWCVFFFFCVTTLTYNSVVFRCCCRCCCHLCPIISVMHPESLNSNGCINLNYCLDKFHILFVLNSVWIYENTTKRKKAGSSNLNDHKK